MKSIMGRIADTRELYGRAIFLRASGWRGNKTVRRISGYHKCMPLADLKALAFKLEHGL
jgi:hypothetical protein